ncbi:MAG: hypothetical protein Q9166_006151 [cf. Caloplaca sp. 2 TL-2023]
MAPKRKNKKAVSNPARGFATISTASKAQLPSDQTSEKTSPSGDNEVQVIEQTPFEGIVPAEKELHELSPSELEARLEESDLQLFVEKYIEKIKKDVFRQVAKLQTDKRLLRAQAESLSTRSWLSPEITDSILQTLELVQLFGDHDNGMRNDRITDRFSEDDLCIKIWTLKQVLMQLGFPNDSCQEALRHLLLISQASSTRDSLAGKDSIWGLDCCLDWLALRCEPHVAPPYSSNRMAVNHMPFLEQRHQNGTKDIDTPTAPKSSSPPSQTTSSDHDNVPSLEGGAVSIDDDAESDTDPETMTDTYVTLQTQLYKLQPDLTLEGSAHAKAISRTAFNLQPRVAKLLQRLERLKADILFDRHDAEQKWSEKRDELAQAAAERRRLHLGSEDRPAPTRPKRRSAQDTTTNHPGGASNDSGEESGAEALGEFFSGLQDTSTSAEGTPATSGVRAEDAVPDAAQSEAYISTTALFLIFSPVPKEEKASLRLPPVWKDFWLELSTQKKNNDMAADREELREIRNLINASTKKDGNRLTSKPSQSKDDPKTNTEYRREASVMLENADRGIDSRTISHLKSVWSSKSTTPLFRKMLRQREALPIWGFKDSILQTICEHQVVIVCGETGCGKSTQVPSFILEHELLLGRACKIYCTEPRRISAISLARRVSEELGERKVDVGTSRSLVGYAIRLESKLVHETRLVYATTGIVMRMLEASDDLQEITHLILDEVHERSIESDFLLIILRKLLLKRPALKVVLMSATVDAAKFSSYFYGAPVMTVPGRTFPVQTRYLEDVIEETNFSNRDFLQGVPSIDDDDEAQDLSSPKDRKEGRIDLEGYSPKTKSTLAKFDEYRINYDMVVDLLVTIATKPKFDGFSKAVLVFLPGIAEIRRVNDMLSGHTTFSHGWHIHPLHSTIAMDEQERAFAIPPPGHRKIVLSTNIAETGVTIPDVTCVIDTGKHKEMRFDERRQLSRLIEVFISRANAKQRRGRAGRVQEGICFHLFTKSRHDMIMAQDQTPEILRLSLQDLVLRVKICKLGGVEQTLAEALDPPLAKNVRRAIDALIDVKALTVSEELTPLGRQLAKLPLDVFLGKLILLGCIYRCLDGALTIAAILSSKLAFKRDAGFIFLEDVEKSSLNKVRSWSSRRCFVEIPARYDINTSDLVLNTVIGWSFYPKLLKRDGKVWRNITNNQTVSLSPTSVNKGAGHPLKWLSFYHIMQSSNKFYNAHETNSMEPFALALACGEAEFKMYSGIIIIDGNRIRFSVDDWKVMLAIKTLRHKLRQINAQLFRDPGHQLSDQQQTWMHFWKKTLEHQAEYQAHTSNKRGAVS